MTTARTRTLPPMSTFTALSLFAGVGSTALALTKLGGDVIAVERDAAAAETLEANGFRVHRADVKEITAADRWDAYGQVDVITGGPPCQPFSQAADNGGEYDPRDCIPDFIEAVRVNRPRVFLMEEVQTLTWRRHAAYLERVLADLRALGYVVDHRVLDLSEYGIPQSRKRLFVIGRRRDTAPVVWWPAKRAEKVTMAQALGWERGDCLGRNARAPRPAQVWDGADVERALWPLRRPSTTVVGSFRPEVQAAPGYRRAGDGPRQNTPGSVVTTLEERLVLQGLPRDWKVCGNEAQRALQVGNSCPHQMTMLLLGANLAQVTA